jgi:enoyl-[acyl-carrier-protein] reductase (NADH)
MRWPPPTTCSCAACTLKRIAALDAQARAALFLACDAASLVTGSAVLVDGGVSINET